MLRLGDPQAHVPIAAGPPRYDSVEDELANRASIHCPIEWDGPVDERGFGALADKRKPHRVVWEMAHGEKLGRRRLTHLCGNRRCLTVEHMDLAGNSQPRRCQIPGCGQNLFTDVHCEEHWDMHRRGETWVTRLAIKTPPA